MGRTYGRLCAVTLRIDPAGKDQKRRIRRASLLLLSLWGLVTASCVVAPLGYGLRAQYFEGAGWEKQAVRFARDPEISTAWMSLRWWFTPPERFSVQWAGFLTVVRGGLYTFTVTSDDGSQLFIDQRLVMDNPGEHGPITRDGQVQLDAGSHPILLKYFQAGGPYVLEWSWARDGGPRTPVPSWALSMTRRDPRFVWLERLLPRVWLVLTLVGMLQCLRLINPRGYWSRIDAGRRARVVARVAILAGLGCFYLLGATEHAERVNTSKARGDQSGYLRDAQEVYANWNGQDPPGLIGGRNRMPLYAGYLALFWHPRVSNDEFFEIGKTWNIRLSLLLLVLLAVVFYTHLPSHIATNLMLIVAFGAFIFKAGYTQSELLFYFLFFLAFLTFWHLLRSTSLRTAFALASVAGVLTGLAQLTKASALPLAGVFLTVYIAREILALIRGRGVVAGDGRRAARQAALSRLAAGAVLVACLLATMYPYIATSKRVYGRYFYNVNTTFYIWYDNWADASVGTRLHGDDVGWPALPSSQLPSMRRYLATHSAGAIAARVGDGFRDMIVGSYSTFWYWKYVLLYATCAAAFVATEPRRFANLARERWPLFAFLALYAAVYLPSVAFYTPISGTGSTRFLIAHLTPLMFVLSAFFARGPCRTSTLRVAGVAVTPDHFHLLVSVTLGLDLIFSLWQRLMSTYGGF